MAAQADDVWPERDPEPHPWPRPRDAAKMLADQFESAEPAALAEPGDLKAIEEAIAAQTAPENVEVRDVRSLSPALVMAYVRTRSAAFYYVLAKEGGHWGIVNRYLVWIN